MACTYVCMYVRMSKDVLGKSKIEQQPNKTEEQKVKEESDDDNNIKAFDFLIESMKREAKLEIQKHNRGVARI